MDELFPADDHVAQWVFSLSMIAGDLMALSAPMKESHELNDVRKMISVYRQMITRLYEARRLVVAERDFPEIRAFVGEHNPFMTKLRDMYLRAEGDKESDIERLYGALRHTSVHYPKVGTDEARDTLRQLGHVAARITMRPDGEMVAEWTTMTAALWILGVQPDSADWLNDFGPRRAVLMDAIGSWGMLWSTVLIVYAARQKVDLDRFVDLTGAPTDEPPRAQPPS